MGCYRQAPSLQPGVKINVGINQGKRQKQEKSFLPWERSSELSLCLSHGLDRDSIVPCNSQPARAARCGMACKALGKQQGAAQPLLWAKKRLGCQATAHQWKQSRDPSNRSWRHPTCMQRDHSSQRWEQMLSWEGMGRSLLSHHCHSAERPHLPGKSALLSATKAFKPWQRETASTSESAQAAASTGDTQELLLSGEPDRQQVALLLSLKLPTCKLV